MTDLFQQPRTCLGRCGCICSRCVQNVINPYGVWGPYAPRATLVVSGRGWIPDAPRFLYTDDDVQAAFEHMIDTMPSTIVTGLPYSDCDCKDD